MQVKKRAQNAGKVHNSQFPQQQAWAPWWTGGPCSGG